MNLKTISIIYLLMITFTNKNIAQDFEWAKSIGSDNSDISYSVCVDDSGNVYTTGWFYGTTDFDPSSGITALTAQGSSDAFITKFDGAGNFIWAKRIGGSGQDLSCSLTLNNDGDLLILGLFRNTVDFDPGVNTFILTAGGELDLFILKLNNSGDFIWCKNFRGNGNTNSIFSKSITLDETGNIYVTGSFVGDYDFDPANSVFTLSTINNLSDVFITKLNSDGGFLWAKVLVGQNESTSYNVKIDNVGNNYSIGYFVGSVDFDPSDDQNILTSSGSYDIFIEKLDSNGNFLWAKKIGSESINDVGFSLGFDKSNNVYFTGQFSGTCDFNPGPENFLLSSLSNNFIDVFVAKLDSEGDFIWAKSFGGIGNDYGHSIFVERNGELFLTGAFEGDVDFNPSTGVSNLSSLGGYDIFISKFDELGNFMGAKSFGGIGADEGLEIKVGSDEAIYLTGKYQEIVDFNPNEGIYNLISNGNSDAFILKLQNCSLQLTQQPIGSIVNLSESVEFIVGIDDNSATFQWQTDIGNGYENIINSGQYLGANNDTLTVIDVNSDNNNQFFKCLVTTEACSEISDAATLRVDKNALSIALTSQQEQFAYPNPFSNLINFKVEKNMIGAQYSIYDISGKLILSGGIQSQDMKIQVDDLSKGVYLLDIGMSSYRLIKL